MCEYELRDRVCVCVCERECVYPRERDNEVKVGSYFGRQVDQGDRVRVCTHVKERESSGFKGH